LTLELSVKCNRCGNIESITLEQINDILKRADQHDKPLSEVTYRCGECHAADAHEAIKRSLFK